MDVTEELAELWGMHAGDGTIYQTNSGVVWEMRGSKHERKWYEGYVVPLPHSLFPYNWLVRERSGNVVGVRCCSRHFIALLQKGGFPIGKKTYDLKVPAAVWNGTNSLKSAFLRGVFATDGYTTLAKINGSSVATYPQIGIGMACEGFVAQIGKILGDLGFRFHMWMSVGQRSGTPTKAFCLRLNGRCQCQKFQKEVGLSNPLDMEKIKAFI